MEARTSAIGSHDIPVAITLHRRGQGLRADDWTITGILCGERFARQRPECTPMREDADGQHLLWAGFRVRFDAAKAADYMLNLNTEPPQVFAICRLEDGGQLVPLAVTVSLDEAQNLEATDLRDARDLVLRVDMPGAIGVPLIDFVNTHYEPPRRKGGRKGPRRERGPDHADR